MVSALSKELLIETLQVSHENTKHKTKTPPNTAATINKKEAAERRAFECEVATILRAERTTPWCCIFRLLLWLVPRCWPAHPFEATLSLSFVAAPAALGCGCTWMDE